MRSSDTQIMKELKKLYFEIYESKEYFESLVEVLDLKRSQRKHELKVLDERPHNWYMDEKMIGMMIYVDLFSNNLKGMIQKIPYLHELGITYVHLMPLLKPRPGENDGGYAVEDYEDIDPNLGTLDDFIELMNALREVGISVCIDYVLNHTSDTHEWAKKALEGDKFYQDMYIMYDNRIYPDEFDKLVPEVLPNKCPGNFTFKEEINKWVFTSFSDFQWDLNFRNPYVFEQMVVIMLDLANFGVNILRLDAIAFMYKKVGTTCRNLEEVHVLLKMLHLIKELVCPSLALLGEAIVEPDEIVKYFGECGILYNANFMVNIFNSIATRDVSLMQIDNRKYKIPSTGCFMNYIRCHDDIGWGFNEEATKKLGFDPFLHKQFLINFYSGNFDGSFSMGESYQYNPLNHDARTNGTLASLLGLESAVLFNDSHARTFALNRIKLATALIFSHRGIPLIYSGDEIATLNDQSYKNNQAKFNESRWVHRPNFDWERAKKRNDMSTDEGIIYQFTKHLISIRKNEHLLSGLIDSKVVDVDNKHVYVFYKKSGEKFILCLFNFSENNQTFSNDKLKMVSQYGIKTDLVTGKKINLDNEKLHLYPYEFLWLK